MSVQIPVQNLANLYIDGLIVSNNVATPNTKLDVSAGQCRNKDTVNVESSNTNDIVVDAVTIDATQNGINGLDTGSLAASTQYYIFALGSSSNTGIPGCMISTSATAPTLPFAYDVFRLIGYWKTDGSVHFYKGYQVGNGNAREFFYDDMIKVLNDGASETLAAIVLTTAVPPVQNTPVYIQDEFTPATASDYVSYVPGDSTATIGQRTYGSVAAKMNGGLHKIISRLVTSAPNIKYINSAASCNVDVWVAGFEFFV